MVTGRFIVGLGVGLASCIVPLYIGELSPTKIRGRLVTINGVAITLGQVVAYGKLQSAWQTSANTSYRFGFPAYPGWMEVDGRSGRVAFSRTASCTRRLARVASAISLFAFGTS